MGVDLSSHFGQGFKIQTHGRCTCRLVDKKEGRGNAHRARKRSEWVIPLNDTPEVAMKLQINWEYEGIVYIITRRHWQIVNVYLLSLLESVDRNVFQLQDSMLVVMCKNQRSASSKDLAYEWSDFGMQCNPSTDCELSTETIKKKRLSWANIH